MPATAGVLLRSCLRGGGDAEGLQAAGFAWIMGSEEAAHVKFNSVCLFSKEMPPLCVPTLELNPTIPTNQPKDASELF